MNQGIQHQYWFVDKDKYFRENRLETSIMTKVQTASQANEDVLLYAGNSLSRESLDIGLIERIRNKTGRVVNDPFESAGWPNELPPTITETKYGNWLTANMPARAQYEKYTDTDGDGMSDDWEEFMGLDKNDPADGAASYLGTGYTNLDVFLQFLIENPIAVIAR